MNQITKEIFIGSRNDIFITADTIEKDEVTLVLKSVALKYPQIKSYLNVAKDLNVEGIEIPKVGLIDGKGNSQETLKEVIWKVEKLIKEHGNVMVFGQKGESRSVLVVLAYLCAKKGMSLEKAYNTIRLKTPNLNINPLLSLMLCECLGEQYFGTTDENPEDVIDKPKPLEGKVTTEAGKLMQPQPKAINANKKPKRGRPAQKK